MQSGTATAPVSKRRVRAGEILSGIAVLFLLFDSIIKVMVIAPVAESFSQLGYPVSVARGIGLLQLICLAVYVVPRTSILGAILLTGYLGGAVATHVRVGSPLLTHVLFPMYIAVLLWGGLYLRDERVRALIAPRS